MGDGRQGTSKVELSAVSRNFSISIRRTTRGQNQKLFPKASCADRKSKRSNRLRMETEMQNKTAFDTRSECDAGILVGCNVQTHIGDIIFESLYLDLILSSYKVLRFFRYALQGCGQNGYSLAGIQVYSLLLSIQEYEYIQIYLYLGAQLIDLYNIIPLYNGYSAINQARQPQAYSTFLYFKTVLAINCTLNGAGGG